MRKIKFRVWDKNNEEMNCVDLCDLAEGDDYWFDGKNTVWGVMYDTTHEQEDFNIMQYTGLKDKNGVEIYEGDILDISSCWWDAAGPAGYDKPIVTVKYDEDITGFEPFNNYDCDCGVVYSANEVKIIGNIYENKELLEK